MEIIKLDLTRKYVFPPLAITIGAYDGIHRGHQRVIERLVFGRKHLKTAVFTFVVHPDYSLSKRKGEAVINAFESKVDFFRRFGLDYLFLLPPAVLKEKATDFNAFLKRLNVVKVVIGCGFVYGLEKKGNSATLADDFEVEVVPNLMYGEQKLSSMTIRALLSEGKIEEVNKLLVSRFCVIGKVVSGEKTGNRLGFKTANLESEKTFPDLKKGVYRVTVRIDSEVFPGIADYGVHPTFKPLSDPRLEVHLLDFDEDLYGREITVEFESFLRSERKFVSEKELIDQIKADIDMLKKGGKKE